MRGLIWLVLGAALYWALRELFGGGHAGNNSQKGTGEEMVRDPHCGVYVPVSSALKKKISGHTVYFCSKECEDNFRSADGADKED